MTDKIIILIYILITFCIAFRNEIPKKIDSYFLVGKSYNTQILIATIFATSVGGGSIFGVAEEFYTYGIIFFFILSGDYLTQILLSICLIPKMDKFIGYSSLGDIVEASFGKAAKSITGISVALVSLGFVSAQLYSSSLIFKYFFGIDPIIGVILTGILVTIYTVFGGLRSVISTDVFQFIVLGVGITILLKISINNIGGIANLTNLIINDTDKILTTDKNYIINMMLSCAIVGFNPSLIQRIMIARDTKQAAESVFFSALLTVPFFLMVGLIAISFFYTDNNINANYIIFEVINRSVPVGIKGIIIAGFMAATMSTADSDLNVASVTVYKDLIGKYIPNNMQIMTIRLLTIFLSIIAIFIATQFDNVIEIIIFTTCFWAPTILVPLISIIFDIRLKKEEFYLLVVVGIIVTIVCKSELFFKEIINGQVIGFLVNLLIFIGIILFRKVSKNAR